MEHFKNPFGPSDFVSARAIDNKAFFDEMLHRAKSHRFYAHPFMSAEDMTASREVVSFILTSFYKIVAPFTGLLCSLSGRSPDLRSRFALMDNIYEEMGRGELNEAHPSLYLEMLGSIGVTPSAAERARTLAPIRRINDHLREVVDQRRFSVACAVLASAESTIPPSFPILAKIAKRAFPEIDTGFFDRHGPRDDGHSDDASMLFAINADSSDYETVDAEVERDLDFRAELFDEWMLALTRGVPAGSAAVVRSSVPLRERTSQRMPPERPTPEGIAVRST